MYRYADGSIYQVDPETRLIAGRHLAARLSEASRPFRLDRNRNGRRALGRACGSLQIGRSPMIMRRTVDAWPAPASSPPAAAMTAATRPPQAAATKPRPRRASRAPRSARRSPRSADHCAFVAGAAVGGADRDAARRRSLHRVRADQRRVRRHPRGGAPPPDRARAARAADRAAELSYRAGNGDRGRSRAARSTAARAAAPSSPPSPATISACSREGEAIIVSDGAGGRARITRADQIQANGVVHSIDTVLMPAE